MVIFARFMDAELEFYMNNDAGKRIIAEQYVGLPHIDI